MHSNFELPFAPTLYLCDNGNEQEEEATRQFSLDLKDLFKDVNSTKKVKALFDKVKNMVDTLESLLIIDSNGEKNCNIYLFLMDFYNQTEQYNLAYQVAVNHLLPSYNKSQILAYFFY
ncbi:hypothetical protein BpHYR1_007278 [Brachionus plicatilis]|uniref:Uncharacterized protein n=1 Tax=Brachionus plicatilis TaxID=10195 RepID=A0A3M7Q3Z1_BRAPC|nr:hypothetical protein BpHYR1_007278 [Brachionus plicatilis]